jgi:hypothetical protein
MRPSAGHGQQCRALAYRISMLAIGLTAAAKDAKVTMRQALTLSLDESSRQIW